MPADDEQEHESPVPAAAVALAVIGLGANLGEPLRTLAAALEDLADLGSLEAFSSPYETVPVGGPPDQPNYVNAVALLRTPLGPHATLAELLRIEDRHGRVRAVRWGPRTLDLDLLDHGGAAIDDADLTLPHPRLMTRAFALVPLAEVLPGWRHPQSGTPLSELLAGVSTGGVTPLAGGWPEGPDQDGGFRRFPGVTPRGPDA